MSIQPIFGGFGQEFDGLRLLSTNKVIWIISGREIQRVAMASMIMTAPFAGVNVAKKLPASNRRGMVVVRASSEPEKMKVAEVSNKNNTRRDLMMAVAAAAACSVANVAMADEPKRGSAEAKKKYAPVCVTMPTARICRN